MRFDSRVSFCPLLVDGLVRIVDAVDLANHTWKVPD